MGRQVAHVRGLLQAPTVPQDRNLLALGLELVTDLESLLRYRNRIAHDQWAPIGIKDHEDGAYGHRPWARSERPCIFSSVSTFQLVSDTWWAVTSGLNNVAFAAGLALPQGSPAPEESWRKARAASAQLVPSRPHLRRGLPPPEWVWITCPPDPRPAITRRVGA